MASLLDQMATRLGNGNNTWNAGNGGDRVYGEGGNDRINGGSGNDYLHGGSGDDLLYGGTGTDVLDGGSGDDRLDGAEGNDTLYGGPGNDTLVAGLGRDQLYGGDGMDVFKFVNTGNGNIGDFNDNFNSANFDQIDFSDLDASSALEHQKFWFHGEGRNMKHDNLQIAPGNIEFINDNVEGQPVTLIYGNDGSGDHFFDLTFVIWLPGHHTVTSHWFTPDSLN